MEVTINHKVCSWSLKITDNVLKKNFTNSTDFGAMTQDKDSNPIEDCRTLTCQGILHQKHQDNQHKTSCTLSRIAAVFHFHFYLDNSVTILPTH